MDLQSTPFGHFGTYPIYFRFWRVDFRIGSRPAESRDELLTFAPCKKQTANLIFQPRFFAREDFYRPDHDPGDWVVVGIHRHGADGVEGFHALNDPAEHGVLAVKIRHRFEADIKLAAVGEAGGIDLIGKTRHGDGAGSVFPADFGLKGITGAAGADLGAVFLPAERVAGLHQDVREDAVKGDPVVESLARQFLEILHRDRSVLVVKLDRDPLQLLLLADLEVHHGDVLGDHQVDGCKNEKQAEKIFFHGIMAVSYTHLTLPTIYSV